MVPGPEGLLVAFQGTDGPGLALAHWVVLGPDGSPLHPARNFAPGLRTSLTLGAFGAGVYGVAYGAAGHGPRATLGAEFAVIDRAGNAQSRTVIEPAPAIGLAAPRAVVWNGERFVVVYNRAGPDVGNVMRFVEIGVDGSIDGPPRVLASPRAGSQALLRLLWTGEALVGLWRVAVEADDVRAVATLHDPLGALLADPLELPEPFPSSVGTIVAITDGREHVVLWSADDGDGARVMSLRGPLFCH